MATDDGLLQAIRAEPDDDTPRLVYADWLEEHGEPERAEFIRVQCRAATLPWDEERDALEDRAEELRRGHEGKWLGQLGRFDGEREFRRGFLDQVELLAEVFLASADHLFRVGPTASLRFRNQYPKPSLDQLLTASSVQRICGLDLRQFENSLGEMAGAMGFEYLRRLDLSPSSREQTSSSGWQEACMRDLRSRPFFPRLRMFAARRCDLPDISISVLERSGALLELESFDLEMNPITDEGVRLLASSPAFARLQKLNVGFTKVTESGILALAESTHLSRLADLSIRCLGGSSGIMRTLASSGLLQRLKRLIFSGHSLRADDAAFLGSFRGPFFLKELELNNSIRPGSALGQLFGSPIMENLETLDISWNDMGPATLAELLASPPPSRLRSLSLAGNPLGDEGSRALARWAGLRQLRCLDLTETRLSSAGLREVLAALDDSPLRRLHLRGNPFGEEGQRILAEAHGLTHLRHLQIHGMNAMGEPLAALMNSSAFPRLSVLEFKFTDMDEGWADVLLNSTLPDRLRQLDIQVYPYLEPADANRLRKRFGWRVTFSPWTRD